VGAGLRIAIARAGNPRRRRALGRTAARPRRRSRLRPVTRLLRQAVSEARERDDGMMDRLTDDEDRNPWSIVNRQSSQCTR